MLKDDLQKLSQAKLKALASFFELATEKCKDVTKLNKTVALRENVGQFLSFMLEHPQYDGKKGLELEKLDEHPVEDLPCKYYALIC